MSTHGPSKSNVVGLGLALVLGACTSSTAVTTTIGTPSTIPQPVVEGLAVAPDSERVDLTMPAFSNSTKVTNPLFPVSSQRSVLLLGQVDGEDFRTEVTLLPETRIIVWNGVPVEVLVSQYVAYLDGRLHEVAYDFYAQDDSGAVWYFGEDVFNFRDGAIVDTHGTWIAGRDGNAAMIMPADPQVGDVYRPENIPGFVFEEVTVKAVDQPLEGPLGLVAGGLVVEELHMDGFTENKTFGPGYGEFLTGGGGNVEALALAVPTDALTGAVLPELESLASDALAVLEAAGTEAWGEMTGASEKMTAAWETVRSGAVPSLIGPRLSNALESLGAAIADQDSIGARQAAITAAMSIFDLQLRYRPAVEIDLARFDLWLAQMQVDAANEDAGAVNGDFFALDYIRDRIMHALSAADVVEVNTRLEELLGAVGDEDFPAVESQAAEIRELISSIEPRV